VIFCNKIRLKTGLGVFIQLLQSTKEQPSPYAFPQPIPEIHNILTIPIIHTYEPLMASNSLETVGTIGGTGGGNTD